MPNPTDDRPTTDLPGDRPPRRRGRRIGRIAFGVVAGLIAVALIAAGLGLWTVQRSFPQQDGELSVTGLDGAVTVQRDALGIPVITADTAHDLFLAQGYVHAQDRFWEMDFRRHVTSGRVAEIFGESQLGTDRFLRTLGWHRIAEEEVAALDETTRGYYEAYAEGVNAYLADHRGADVSLEYAVLGLTNGSYEIEPWTPADSVAWLKAMAWDLRSNLDEEIERALLAPHLPAAEIAELYPDYPFETNPTIVSDVEASGAGAGAAVVDTAGAVDWAGVSALLANAGAVLGSTAEGVGSNSWVVSGAHTESGLPLLANDPHLGATLPSVWHQSALRCSTVDDDCPFDVTGFGFSGVPGVIIGHNARVAWGFTNLTTDVADLYIERIEGDTYWRDGAAIPLTSRTETLKVAGGDDVELVVRETAHGPLLGGLTPDYTAIADTPTVGASVDASLVPAPDPGAGTYDVALRWTALEPGTTAASIFALDRAQNWEDFRAAAQLFDVPAQNLVYADVDGNIGYQTPGALPLRGTGDGSVPQPGWDSAYDWTGTIPFDELPSVLNPDSGYLVTANNAIVGESYPHALTKDWDYGWRAARIVELLDRGIAAGSLTVADMREIQSDDQFWMGKRLVDVLHEDSVVALLEDDATRDAVELLSGWDAQNTGDSAAAAYANVYWDTLVSTLFTSPDVAIPLTSQSRMFLVVDRLLDDPTAARWGPQGRDALLAEVARTALDRLSARQGTDPARWNWGDLHAITLRSDTFGESGIAPIEWLFNRGPFPVEGGASIVNATGWDLGADDFQTVTVPSMRMIVDLDDLDGSTWNHLTGTSGHAFHTNYTDQFSTWQAEHGTPWAFSEKAVAAATTHTLTLVPKE